MLKRRVCVTCDLLNLRFHAEKARVYVTCDLLNLRFHAEKARVYVTCNLLKRRISTTCHHRDEIGKQHLACTLHLGRQVTGLLHALLNLRLHAVIKISATCCHRDEIAR